MVQRLSCLVLVRYRARAGPTPLEVTAQALHECASLDRTYQNAMSALVNMIERGDSYESLERDVGGGVCLVLGTSLPETQYVAVLTSCRKHADQQSWTKLMTKTTDKRPRVINHLTTATPVPELALRSRALQERIIDAKVDSLIFGPFLTDRAAQDIDAFEAGLNALDETTPDFTDAAFDETWRLHTL